MSLFIHQDPDSTITRVVPVRQIISAWLDIDSDSDCYTIHVKQPYGNDETFEYDDAATAQAAWNELLHKLRMLG